MCNLGSVAVEDLGLNAKELLEFDALLENLKTVESVTQKLQEKTKYIAEVRFIFDAVIEKFPATSLNLGAHAAIVQSPDFESGIVKVKISNSSALNREERAALSVMVIPQSEPSNSRDEGLSFAE